MFYSSFYVPGPIKNIVDNTQEITRSMTCAAELTANHSKLKMKFRLKPIGNLLTDMKVKNAIFVDKQIVKCENLCCHIALNSVACAFMLGVHDIIICSFRSIK